jgi:hypothetical protein
MLGSPMRHRQQHQAAKLRQRPPLHRTEVAIPASKKDHNVFPFHKDKLTLQLI